MGLKKKVKDSAWIAIVCISMSLLTGALWIRKTYGVLALAMIDESFLNYLENKRSLFLMYVAFPVALVFALLVILQVLLYKRRLAVNVRKLTYASCLFLLLSIFGAVLCLDAGAYLSRQYRMGEEQWYDSDRVIVHALGEIDGITYTNSREALETSCNNGRRLLECDLIMTADNQVVACHDWDLWLGYNKDAGFLEEGGAIPSYDEFMAGQTKGGYTPLSGEELVLFMKEHPDIYIITDTKEADPQILKEPFHALVDLAKKHDCEEVLDHFVIQIYHGYMYGVIKEIYPFSNYIFTLYQEGYRGKEEKMEEYAKFCMLNNIDVVTMNADYYHDRLLDICNKYGLQLFVHTVNDEAEINSLINKGVGVYTDVTDL